MARIALCTMIVLLLTMNWFSTIASTATSRRSRRPSHLRAQSSPPGLRTSSTLSRRGVPGMPGDIEWMGFYGSLLAVPTMLSVLGIVTNYNLEKSYFNSQLNAEYYRQTREMLRAHTAKLIKEQEEKFAKQGTTWKGMVYDQDGKVRSGVKQPSWGGKVLGVEDEVPPKKGGDGGGGGAPAIGQARGEQGGGATGASSQGASGEGAGAGQTGDARSGANGESSPTGAEAGGTSTVDGQLGGTAVGTGAGLAPGSAAGASQDMQGSATKDPEEGVGGQRSGDSRGEDAAGAREGSGEDESDNSRSGLDNDGQGSDPDSGDGGDAASA